MFKLSYFPSDPESWSETLTPPEGKWVAGATYATVVLDTAFFSSGNASIMHRIRGLEGLQNTFEFQLASPLDITRFEQFVYTHALSTQAFDGNAGIMFIDSSGRYRRRFLVTNTLQLFEQHVLDLFAGAWEDDIRGFDPTNVVTIVYFAFYKSGYVGDSDQWVDKPFFYTSAPPPQPFQKLSVNGQDIKGNTVAPNTKTIKLTSPDGFANIFWLPFGPRGLTDGIWTVEALNADFVRWSDGDTNPLKTLTIVTGDPDIVLTAIYSTGGGNGKPLPDLAIIVAVAITVAVGLVLVGR